MGGTGRVDFSRSTCLKSHHWSYVWKEIKAFQRSVTFCVLVELINTQRLQGYDFIIITIVAVYQHDYLDHSRSPPFLSRSVSITRCQTTATCPTSLNATNLFTHPFSILECFPQNPQSKEKGTCSFNDTRLHRCNHRCFPYTPAKHV